MPHIATEMGHTNHSFGNIAQRIREEYVFTLQQFQVAHQPLIGLQAMPGNVFSINLLVRRTITHDGFSDGVIARLLDSRHRLECLLIQSLHTLHGKFARGERASLVEHHQINLGNGVKVVAPLEQNAPLGGRTDARKIAQRHADDQRAGARDNQEDQRTAEPLAENVGKVGVEQTI